MRKYHAQAATYQTFTGRVGRRVTASGAPGGRATGLLLIVALASGGCKNEERAFAASTNRPQTEEEVRQVDVLDEAAQREAIAAMRSVTAGQTPTDRPTPGVRWAHLDSSVSAACESIEAAVVRTYRDAENRKVRFEFETIEGWPGELVVTRVDGPALYHAEARIGRFPDKPERAARATELLRALDESMAAYGKKRRFDE